MKVLCIHGIVGRKAMNTNYRCEIGVSGRFD
jgi:hypothetical protein